jgi:hypothetical protein
MGLELDHVEPWRNVNGGIYLTIRDHRLSEEIVIHVKNELKPAKLLRELLAQGDLDEVDSPP